MFNEKPYGEFLENALQTGNMEQALIYLTKRPQITNKHYFACGQGFVNSTHWSLMMEQLSMMQHRLRYTNQPVPVTHSSKFLELPKDDPRLMLFRGILSLVNEKNRRPELLSKERIEEIRYTISTLDYCPYFYYACGLLSTIPELKSFAVDLFKAINQEQTALSQLQSNGPK